MSYVDNSRNNDAFARLKTLRVESFSPRVYTARDIAGALTVAMAILARLGVNIAANIGFQYAAEMLPTVVRAQGVSLIHIIGYLAHIVGPYVIYLVSILGDSCREIDDDETTDDD